MQTVSEEVKVGGNTLSLAHLDSEHPELAECVVSVDVAAP